MRRRGNDGTLGSPRNRRSVPRSFDFAPPVKRDSSTELLSGRKRKQAWRGSGGAAAGIATT